jgi:3'-phosphoadenosine 5'-phosphosulfate sulfotransferase (PAPS reductase)/FAD synthetase
VNEHLQKLINDAYGVISLYVTAKSTMRTLYSGGKDSTVVAHLASHHPSFNGVAHIQTMTGPASWRHSQQVIAMASKLGWDCLTAEPATTMPMIIAKYGFPGPAAHTSVYIWLKERPIRQLAIMARKKDKRKHVTWLSGIRRAESADRAKKATERTVVSSGEWWINPILDWTDDDVRLYVNTFGLEVSSWHHSNDCYCGSYATPEEHALIDAVDAEQSEYIKLLEVIAHAARDIQVLEAQIGMRSPDNVIAEEFCTWGHGHNKSSILDIPTPKISICNKCGVTDGILDQLKAKRTSA